MEKKNKKGISKLGIRLCSLTHNTAYIKDLILKNTLIEITDNALFEEKLRQQDSEKN